MRPGARVLGVLLAALSLSAPARAVPMFDAVRAAHTPSDLPVTDRHGATLQRLRINDRVRRLDWVPLDDLSPALRAAVVLGEDRRFWSHGGVDWAALARGAFATTLNQRTQGGSTLTMQLAALLDDDLARPPGGRSVPQKLTQMGRAMALERDWTKAQIFEAYLNRVPLRGEAVGVNAGVQMLFGKHPRGLDMLESALLAAMVRAPNADEATLVRRSCALLAAQAWPCDGLGSVAARALARRAGPALGEALAPHAARLAWAQWRAAAPRGAPPPPRLATTLDATLQRTAIEALTRQLAELQGRAVNDGAVVVLDNASGEVLAWVGSAGAATSDAPAVDAVLARRQPGSALKPFVYGLAFEQRLLTAATPLNDAPSAWPAGAGQYVPGNYDGGHRGWVPARVALAASLNVPAVQVAALVSPELLFDRLNALGLDLPHTAGHHGLSMALGSAEVTLIDLANAYRTLARGGQRADWRLRPGGPMAPPHPVMDPAAAALVGEILADNAARASGFGLDSPLVTRGFAAVKTGTSKDMRDNWCVGFTDRYTVGVWVGNAAGAPMHGVSGTTGAAPVWRELVARLHAQRPSQLPRVDPALAPRVAAMRGGSEGAVADTASAVPAGQWVSGIRHPKDGHRFAIDPDVPPAQQRIVFEGEAGDWWLDGRRLGGGARLAWSPWPGRHRLELRGADGRVLDRVEFEVRGATLRPRAGLQDAGNMRSSAASITRPKTL